MSYNWQQEDWPHFRYAPHAIREEEIAFAENAGQVHGMLTALPEDPRMQSVIDMMVVEALKTSAIEGEVLSRRDVWSSIRNNLGLNPIPEKIRDRKAAGIARLMVVVRESFSEALTQDMLFSWHRMLMEGYPRIQAGRWRSHEEPMQIISGHIGREVVHFEAPPSSRVLEEMERFIQWFNETAPGKHRSIDSPLIRSAITHLYFESIHPFEDGNGRIGRALAEKALSQGIKRPVLLSLSKTIETKRKDYYEALNAAQRSNEITAWIQFFARIIQEAQAQAKEQIGFSLQKTQFFDKVSEKINPRQEKVLRRMLEEGPNGFEGGMNAKKYMSITQTSKATATRDLQDLVRLGIFLPAGGGRSRHYEINIP